MVYPDYKAKNLVTFQSKMRKADQKKNDHYVYVDLFKIYKIFSCMGHILRNTSLRLAQPVLLLLFIDDPLYS